MDSHGWLSFPLLSHASLGIHYSVVINGFSLLPLNYDRFADYSVTILICHTAWHRVNQRCTRLMRYEIPIARQLRLGESLIFKAIRSKRLWFKPIFAGRVNKIMNFCCALLGGVHVRTYACICNVQFSLWCLVVCNKLQAMHAASSLAPLSTHKGTERNEGVLMK